MSEQLTLALDEDGGALAPSPPRLPWRFATHGGRPFDDAGRFFEPWWPGTHAYLTRSGGRTEMRTEHLSDPLAAFPELLGICSHMAPADIVVEGTLLALDEQGRPDASLLREHLTGASARPAEGAFVASDLPWLEGRDLTREPFSERRRRLAAAFEDSAHGVLSRGLVGEGVTLALAVAAMGLGAISARRLDARWQAGSAADAWLHLPVSEPPASETRPFLVLLERLPLDG